MVLFKEPFVPGEFYHIYNRGNNRERIFLQERNYEYFRSKWEHYINPIMDVYAYCLLPNHFHFLCKVKDDIHQPLQLSHKVIDDPVIINQSISRKFQHMFSGYALAINKQEKRVGSLFQKRFKRKKIDSEEFLFQIIQYIHLNPVKHNLCLSPFDWQWSSLREIANNDNRFVKATEVIDIFGSREEFLAFHLETAYSYYNFDPISPLEYFQTFEF